MEQASAKLQDAQRKLTEAEQNNTSPADIKAAQRLVDEAEVLLNNLVKQIEKAVQQATDSFEAVDGMDDKTLQKQMDALQSDMDSLEEKKESLETEIQNKRESFNSDTPTWEECTENNGLDCRIVLTRPFIEHMMHSCVLTVAGRDTGATLFGPAGAFPRAPTLRASCLQMCRPQLRRHAARGKRTSKDD